MLTMNCYLRQQIVYLFLLLLFYCCLNYPPLLPPLPSCMKGRPCLWEHVPESKYLLIAWVLLILIVYALEHRDDWFFIRRRWLFFPFFLSVFGLVAVAANSPCMSMWWLEITGTGIEYRNWLKRTCIVKLAFAFSMRYERLLYTWRCNPIMLPRTALLRKSIRLFFVFSSTFAIGGIAWCFALTLPLCHYVPLRPRWQTLRAALSEFFFQVNWVACGRSRVVFWSTKRRLSANGMPSMRDALIWCTSSQMWRVWIGWAVSEEHVKNKKNSLDHLPLTPPNL